MRVHWMKGHQLRGHRRGRPFLITVSAVGIITGLSVGAAYAYFTSSGNGAGSPSISSMQTVTVAAITSTPSNLLQPGGTGDVTLQVTNPNGFPVTLMSVIGSGTITADASHPDCTVTGVTFTKQPALSKTIAASSTILVDLPNAAVMDTTSANGCQGATFSIPVTITVQT